MGLLILRTLWLILCCGSAIDMIIVLGIILWHIFFDKDEKTHITKSIQPIGEDQDED